jgi:hypothetical protein
LLKDQRAKKKDLEEAVQKAILNGHFSVVQLFLLNNWDPSKDDNRAYHYAVSKNFKKLARLLKNDPRVQKKLEEEGP